VVEKEHTYYFHLTQSMDKHTKQQIKLDLCEWHKALCYVYKNVTSLEEVNGWFVAIQCWWYSFRATHGVGLQELEDWFIFDIFVLCNGEGLWNMLGFKHSVTSFIPSHLGYIFKKFYNIISKEGDIDLFCFAKVISIRGCKHAYMQPFKNCA